MTLDERLLDILACPADHHTALERTRDDDNFVIALTCPTCQRTFEVQDQIPTLLL